MEKISYRTLVVLNLVRKQMEPGDVLTLCVRNDECTDGMYKQALRLVHLFLHSFNFWPEQVALHPDHIALLKKQARSLDILIDEKMADILGKRVDLSSLPRVVPLVEDSTLDLFSAVARHAFRLEDARDVAGDMISAMLGIDLKEL